MAFNWLRNKITQFNDYFFGRMEEEKELEQEATPYTIPESTPQDTENLITLKQKKNRKAKRRFKKLTVVQKQ